MAGKSVTGLAGFVRGIEGGDVWIGVDVHKNKYFAAIVSETGACHDWSCPADPEGFVRQIKKLALDIKTVAYEAGPTGFVLARALQAAGLSALVAAPSRIMRPVTAGAKSDRLDCRKLAELALRGMLKAIAAPTEAEEGRRSLCRRRHRLADGLRRVKQRIKSLLLEFGLVEPMGLQHWSRASLAALKELPMPPGADLTLASLIRELEFLEQEMAGVRKGLKAAAESERNQASMKYMRTVPGVGLVTASTFCLELFRPERFRSSAELASYLGLAPMTRHSGQAKARARLRPVGQKRLRSLLIEAAWAWKRRDARAESMYRRLVARHGLPQKAIAALARKLAIILWRLCLEHRPYRMEPLSA